MNRLIRCLSAACLLVVFVLAVACHKNPPPKTQPLPPPPPPPVATPAPPPPPPPPPPPAPKPAPAPAPLTEDEIFGRKSLSDLNAEKPLGDVLFDYDQSTVRADAQPILQKDADWLKRWATTKIIVEGHCDMRGTAEYNLALGERRANAVKDYLVTLGVPADRITTVSKGKEEQLCTEQSEDCWQRNRRGHFIITAK